MPLSVLSLNVWNNSGPYEARRRRMREWIERLNPDLIGLQEVVRGDCVDELNDLVGGLGYYLDYARAVPFWLDQSLEFGNAVASRWPIIDREVIQIPDAGDDEQRVAPSVTIDAPFGPVGFTTTQWFMLRVNRSGAWHKSTSTSPRRIMSRTSVSPGRTERSVPRWMSCKTPTTVHPRTAQWARAKAS